MKRAVVVLALGALVGCGDNNQPTTAPGSVPSQPVAATPTPAPVAQPAEAPPEESSRWEFSADHSGATVRFVGKGFGEAQVSWNGPGSGYPAWINRAFSEPPNGPYTFNPGEIHFFATPEGVCGGNFEIDLQTPAGTVAWKHVIFDPCPEPTPTPPTATPTPTPEPTPTPTPEPTPTPTPEPTPTPSPTPEPGQCYYRVSCGITFSHGTSCTDQNQQDICESTRSCVGGVKVGIFCVGGHWVSGIWRNFGEASLMNHCQFPVPGVSLDNFQLNPGKSDAGCLSKND